MTVRRAMACGVVAAAVVMLPAGGVGAHHGWTNYDSDRMVTLRGPIREATFEHPHVMLRVEAEGKVWSIVLPPPTRAVGLGLTREWLVVGRTGTFAGHPHRTVSDEMRARRITIGDRTIDFR